MRFRPSPNAQKKLAEPRPDATAETQGSNQRVFDKSRQSEIERAENVAAGLPPEGAPRPATAVGVRRQKRLTASRTSIRRKR